MRTDALLQARNQLYWISIGVSLIVGGALAWLSPREQVAGTFPMALLMFVGGSTLLYVVAMVILEKDDGTLQAISVSPLRPWEYLSAKVASLTAIATLEGLLISGGALLFLSRSGPVVWPSALLLVGLVALSVMHVLVGVLLVVRYDRILEALIPMSAIATMMQVPALYFVGALDSALILAIPTAAPTMLIQGAFVALEPWEWVYAATVTTAAIGALSFWGLRAFRRHVTEGRG